LPEETVFLCFQVRSLDAKRFPKKLAGQLSDDLMDTIAATVRYCLGL
jgi:mRNA interferase MazF